MVVEFEDNERWTIKRYGQEAECVSDASTVNTADHLTALQRQIYRIDYESVTLVNRTAQSYTFNRFVTFIIFTFGFSKNVHVQLYKLKQFNLTGIPNLLQLVNK